MAIGKDKTKLDFALTWQEKALLEKYCALVGRTKTDVLRELIRGLQQRFDQWEADEKTIDNQSN